MDRTFPSFKRESVIILLLARYKLHRQFKCFFAYIVAQILTFSLIFPSYMSQYHRVDVYLYWTTNAAGVLLGFLVIHEVFLDVFRPFHTLRDLAMVLAKWAGRLVVLHGRRRGLDFRQFPATLRRGCRPGRSTPSVGYALFR